MSEQERDAKARDEFLGALRCIPMFGAKTEEERRIVDLTIFNVLTIIDGVSVYNGCKPITLRQGRGEITAGVYLHDEWYVKPDV